MNILSVRNLKKYYNTGENTVKALDGIDLDICKGEFLAVVGTSGSGKSTLLQNLGGLDNPTSGEIIIDGRKWVHKWHLSEIGSSETYYTALAKERVLKINIQYNFFIPEKYYHPDSPRPGWMKSAYESVNTIMSSIRLKPPPGYDEEADPYIVKPAKAQQ